MYQDEVSIGTTKQQFEYDALGRVIRKELLDGNSSLIDESIEHLQYGENSLNLVKEHNVRIRGVFGLIGGSGSQSVNKITKRLFSQMPFKTSKMPKMQ